MQVLGVQAVIINLLEMVSDLELAVTGVVPEINLVRRIQIMGVVMISEMILGPVGIQITCVGLEIICHPTAKIDRMITRTGTAMCKVVIIDGMKIMIPEILTCNALNAMDGVTTQRHVPLKRRLEHAIIVVKLVIW